MTRERPTRDVRRESGGFTLVELLLVAVILAIATGLSIPVFLRSYRGAQLRSSARAVVMAARYARALAVLQQAPAALFFDRSGGRIEVVLLEERTPPSGTGPWEESGRPASAAREGETPALQSRLRRSLGEGVVFTELRGLEGGDDDEEMYWTLYQPNGMAEDFSVALRDRDGRRAIIRIDGLSGRPRVEYP